MNTKPKIKINKKIISKLLFDVLNQPVKDIQKMVMGICNEVYLVVLENNSEVVLRLNKEKKYLYGSHENIPLFKSKNIKVPEIIFEDYSLKKIPYHFQILSKIEGQDIGKIFFKLKNRELKNIAKELASIIIKLKSLPTNGKFGDTVGGPESQFDSWLDVIKEGVKTIYSRNEKTSVLDEKIKKILDYVIERYSSYFKSIKSEFYYDDMCSKNVMIYNGKFNGLVDLDSIAFGDYLDAIGRIKASWYNTKKGDLYLKTIMNELKLGEREKEMVDVYSIYNLISWTSEQGIQFNSNTSAKIDWDYVEKNKKKIIMMSNEIKNPQ